MSKIKREETKSGLTRTTTMINTSKNVCETRMKRKDYRTHQQTEDLVVYRMKNKICINVYAYIFLNTYLRDRNTVCV